MAEKTMTEELLTQAKSLVKQKVELDGQQRPWKAYTASTSAKHGTPCTVTEYVYLSPTSTVIVARKEGHSTWDSAWDASFTISE